MKKIIAGVDEVGRGSLVGPVYAGAVILNKKINTKLLKDSKLLSKQNRERLNIYIKKNSSWSIGKASVKEIEKFNILNASLLAMKRAIKKLRRKPNLVIIDGNKIPEIKNYKVIVTFHPAYLLRKPDQKKFSWEDLKIIRKEIDDQNIII